MVHYRLKKIIFDKLYKDLSKAEIIPFEGNIWFINRENKYWYLEYKKRGDLWWRFNFFDNFFHVFSLERSEYEPLICEWVEEVLNRKVVTPNTFTKTIHIKVEEVLNYKVTASDEVLNNKVTASDWDKPSRTGWVEEVLNCKVITPRDFPFTNRSEMGEVLNCKVIKPIITNIEPDEMVEEVLNCKVITPNKTSAAGNRQQSPYPLF